MARLFLVFMLIAGLMLAGCSKKDEDVDSIGKEAAEDNAAAVMDSLNNQGAGAVQKEQGKTAVDTPKTAVKPSTETAKKPSVDYSGLSGFVVQVGSYSSYDFAKMMADKFSGRDYPAFIVSTEIDGTTYYRLRIGVYETYEEAKEIGELVKDRYSVTYWIDNN